MKVAAQMKELRYEGHLRCMKVVLHTNCGVCVAYISVPKALLNFAARQSIIAEGRIITCTFISPLANHYL